MCSAGEVGGHKAEVIFKDDSVTDGKTCKPGSACSKGCLPCPTYKPNCKPSAPAPWVTNQ